MLNWLDFIALCLFFPVMLTKNSFAYLAYEWLRKQIQTWLANRPTSTPKEEPAPTIADPSVPL